MQNCSFSLTQKCLKQSKRALKMSKFLLWHLIITLLVYFNHKRPILHFSHLFVNQIFIANTTMQRKSDFLLFQNIKKKILFKVGDSYKIQIFSITAQIAQHANPSQKFVCIRIPLWAQLVSIACLANVNQAKKWLQKYRQQSHAISGPIFGKADISIYSRFNSRLHFIFLKLRPF